MTTELTPEAQAVLDAAMALASGDGRYGAFEDAVEAYKASINPPEPFTRYMARYDDHWTVESFDDHEGCWTSADVVYECLITPVKRVR